MIALSKKALVSFVLRLQAAQFEKGVSLVLCLALRRHAKYYFFLSSSRREMEPRNVISVHYSMKWKYFRVSQASSKSLRQLFIPCSEASFALVRPSRDSGLREWGRPKLSIVVVPVITEKGVNLARVNKNGMRRDLENELKERIATILSRDFG